MKFLDHFKANWMTTVSGIATLAIAGVAIYQDPSALAKPETQSALTLGVGLLLASDSRAKATPPKPQEPPKS